MKLILLFSLLALAFGSNDVAVPDRDLAVDDRFHVSGFAICTAGDPGCGPYTFTIAATHEDPTVAGDARVANVYTTCPHEAGPAGTPASGVTVGTTNVPGTSATITIEVDGSFFSTSPIPNSVITKSFCVWYGTGVGGAFYGFREAQFTLTWTFTENWSLTSFTTQAYDPVTRTVTKTITAKAVDCGDLSVMVGEALCVKVCSDDKEFDINACSVLTAKDQAVAPVTPLPDFNVLTAAVKTTTVTPATPSDGGCYRIDYLLPISYFPASAGDAPALTVRTFKYDGECSFVASGQRRLVASRSLQQQQDGYTVENGVAKVDGEVQYNLMSSQESSASSVVAGAAATAAAVGAALLI